MDLSPLIVLVVFVALIAFSTRSRLQDDRDGRPGSVLKPPGEACDAGRSAHFGD